MYSLAGQTYPEVLVDAKQKAPFCHDGASHRFEAVPSLLQTALDPKLRRAFYFLNRKCVHIFELAWMLCSVAQLPCRVTLEWAWRGSRYGGKPKRSSNLRSSWSPSQIGKGNRTDPTITCYTLWYTSGYWLMRFRAQRGIQSNLQH